MLLTKGIIKADLIAARPAIEYFQKKEFVILRISQLIIFSRHQRNLLNTRYTRVCLM